MQILSKRENSVKAKPQVAEDLWHLSKIIFSGDLASGSTDRKFVSESGRQERKHVFIKLVVEKAEFHKPSGRLKILGTIVEGHPEEFVQVGQHHSLEVGLGDIIGIEKKEWKKYELDRLKEAERAAKQPVIGVLVMDERDAEFFAIKQYGTESLGKAVLSGVGKYAEAPKDVKNKWYAEILSILSTTINAEIPRIILAGPGFEKENFAKYVKDRDQAVFKKLVVKPIGNTGVQGVYELVKIGAIDEIVKQSRFAEETGAIERLVFEISRERPKATYGLGKVAHAVQAGAADTLLVLDSFLFENRDKAEPIIEKAEKLKAKVLVVSGENEASEKLRALGSIAALLRYAFE